MSTNELTGLQMAVRLLAEIGDERSDAAIDAVHDLADERVTLQHHACDLAQRVADLEAERDELIDQRDRGDAQNDLLLAELRQVNTERDALRARLAEIEARATSAEEQSVLMLKKANNLRARNAILKGALSRGEAMVTINAAQLRHALDFAAPDFDRDVDQRETDVTIAWREAGEVIGDDGQPEPSGHVAWLTEYPEEGCLPLQESWSSGTANEAEPDAAPAQAVPDADGARFRWLCEDHSDRETREQCRSLIDRLSVMSYSAAVMSIDAAMTAAPEHKA